MTLLLNLLPSRAGYNEEARAAASLFSVEGGRPRGRLDLDEPASRVSVGWKLRTGRAMQLQAFYRQVTEGPNGPEPFEIDLLLDSPELQRYQAQFVPNTFRLEGISGGTYIFKALLEVEPLEMPDAEYDQILVDLYTEYGFDGEANEILALLAEVANEDLRI